MEDRVLTRNAYSLMFIVLAIWSFIPYLISNDISLLVFSRINLSLELLFVAISMIAAHGTFYGRKHGYFAGVATILITISYLGYEQLIIKEMNILQLATLITMLVILGIYSTAFRTTQPPRRKRLSTMELRLETGI